MDPVKRDFDLPRIESETMRKQDGHERKGAGFLVGLLSKLGLGESVLGEAGILGGLMATNAGMVALVLAGTTIAAGTGMYLSFSGPSQVSPNAAMSGLIPKNEGASPSSSEMTKAP